MKSEKLCECGCGQQVGIAKGGPNRGQPNRFVHGHNRRSLPDPEPPNPSGMCQCGCGEEAPIADRTIRRIGHVKGEPIRFVHGHNADSGEEHRWWDGGRTVVNGYVRVKRPNHPRADRRGYIAEHRLVAEKAMGRPLPDGAVIHHVNGDAADNRPENLVVCEDQGYHNLLHQRQRALDACGHADWRKCWICGEHDAPDAEDFRVPDEPGQSPYHRECAARYERQRREEARP